MNGCAFCAVVSQVFGALRDDQMPVEPIGYSPDTAHAIALGALTAGWVMGVASARAGTVDAATGALCPAHRQCLASAIVSARALANERGAPDEIGRALSSMVAPLRVVE